MLLVRRGERAVPRPVGAARRASSSPERTSRPRRARELRGGDRRSRRGPAHLEQLATYGAPEPRPADARGHRRLPRARPRPARRRPRARTPPTRAGRRSADADRGRLAFDHAGSCADGVERARAKLEYTPLATAFCAPEFTVAELRRVYEVVWGAAARPAQLPPQGHRRGGLPRADRRHHHPRRRPPRPALPAREDGPAVPADVASVTLRPRRAHVRRPRRTRRLLPTSRVRAARRRGWA